MTKQNKCDFGNHVFHKKCSNLCTNDVTWWRHQMETFSALLAICAGNSPVPGEFPTQRPVTRSFDVFFDLCLNKRLSKQSWGWWFETLSHKLWRQCNDLWLTETDWGKVVCCQALGHGRNQCLPYFMAPHGFPSDQYHIATGNARIYHGVLQGLWNQSYNC